mmetsp:Transcript_14703/g.36994  ORF Transcript_14703/g.36994 Transcript_14703/m.36994 type:complete len:240 (-) Transcript_14703:375-1094(-)
MNRPFAEENHIARLTCGLNDKFFILFPVHHALGHLEVGFVRTGHDAKATVTGIVVSQNDIASQQCRSDRSVVAVVGQMGVVLAGCAVDRPPVQLESLRTGVLRQNHGQVVHAVSLAEDSVKDGNKAWVGQNALEDSGVFFSPFQTPAQIHSSGALAKESCAFLGIPQRGIGSFHHFVCVVVNGGVGLLDFLGRQNTSDNQVSIQIKEIPLVLRHFDGIFHFGCCKRFCRIVFRADECGL